MKTSFEQIRISHNASVLPGKAIPPDTLRLGRGDVVDGRVIRSIPPKHAVLLIQGQRIMAETKVPLKEGEVVSLKVLQVGPQYVLRVVESTGEPSQGVNHCKKLCGLGGFPYKSLLDLLAPFMAADGKLKQEDLPDEWVKIWRLLRDITVVPGREQNAPALQKALHNSGMFWEGKLGSAFRSGADGLFQIHLPIDGDLKGGLLGSMLTSRGSEMLGSDLIGKCLDGLEQLQLLNVSAMEDKGKCLFVIPLRFNGAFSFAQLLIDLGDGCGHGGEKQGKNGIYAIQLLLDMSALGPVHVEASVFKKVIKVNFLVSHEAVKEQFENGIGYLTEALAASGFIVKQVGCRCTDRENGVPTTLVDEILDQEKHHISLVV